MSSTGSRPSLQSVCTCRSPRRSPTSTSLGSPIAAASLISSIPCRSSGATYWRPRRSYNASSSAKRSSSPLSTSVSPYSLSDSPSLRACSRSSMLCCRLPVEYASSAPKLAASTTRRSTCTPSLSTTAAFVSPCTSTVETFGCSTSVSSTCRGSPAAHTRSMSPIVSSKRRRLPAARSAVMLGQRSRSAAISRSAAGIARAIGTRSSLVRAARISRRTLSAFFRPILGSSASCPASVAFSRSATVETPSSSLISLAVFGPMPGTRMTSRMPSGNSARSRSKYAMRPVVTSSVVLAAMALPTPGISVRSAPSRTACSMSAGWWPRARAARWYATTVKRFSPFISSRPAMSWKTSAISELFTLRPAWPRRVE